MSSTSDQLDAIASSSTALRCTEAAHTLSAVCVTAETAALEPLDYLILSIFSWYCCCCISPAAVDFT
jgi:hypothetical protein